MTVELHTTDHQIDVPLMERKVCHGCGHLHRVILIRKCDCCAADKARWDEQRQAAQDEAREIAEGLGYAVA
jgi:hypothetical protein